MNKKIELDLTFITKSNFYHLNATEKGSIRGASTPGNTWLPHLFIKSGLHFAAFAIKTPISKKIKLNKLV